MSHDASVADPVITNGINVTEYEEIVRAVREEPDLARFRFRARNRWDSGGLNRTTIEGFCGAGEEQGNRSFVVEADEPPALLGEDQAPNPVEYVLHALAACLTSSIVYKAAARGIRVGSVESSLEGDLDARRFLELSSEGRLGYRNITATFRVEADASPEELAELAEFSPVLDVIRNGTQVSLRIEPA